MPLPEELKQAIPGLLTHRQAMERQDSKQTPHLNTTYKGLDRYIGGPHGGGWRLPWFVLLAARPSVGKTTFALNLLRRMECPRLFISLEMNLDELLEEITKDEVREPERLLYTDELRSLPSICDAIAIAGQQGVPFVVLDYINLVQLEGGQDLDNAGMSRVSRALRRAGRDNGVTLLCIAQLNRQCEGRVDQRPKMSDLRESGTLEQDADCIVFLFSESYHQPDNPQASNEMELIIAKQRQGKRGITVYFDFDKERATFREITRELNPLRAPRDAEQVRAQRQDRQSPESAPGRAVLRRNILGQE